MDIRDIQIRVERLRAEQAAQVLDHIVAETARACPGVATEILVGAITRGIASLYAAPMPEPLPEQKPGQKPNDSGFAQFFNATRTDRGICAEMAGGAL